MKATGPEAACQECGLRYTATASGTTPRHDLIDFGVYGGYSICKGSYLPPVCSCSQCGKRLPPGEGGRFRHHFADGTGAILMCSGSDERLLPAANAQTAAEDLVKRIASVFSVPSWQMPQNVISPVPLDRVRGAGRSHRPRHDLIPVPEEPVALAEPVLPVPVQETELCKGGTEARVGCIRCGDRIYMTATGRDGQTAPASFEDWRDDHTKYGVPWAKERMLEYLKDYHVGILDEAWKPPVVDVADPAATVHRKKLPLNQMLPTSVAAIAGGTYLAGWIITGKLEYFLITAIFMIFVTMGVVRMIEKSRENST